MSAEYITAGSNHNIIFCERGVRSSVTAYRNMLDVTAIAVLKKETHPPVMVNPSPGHAVGKAWMVPALSAQPLQLELTVFLSKCNPYLYTPWCDADQSLNPSELADLM